MVALAEEEGVTTAVAVDDVGQANAAVNPEDAVPRYAGKSRCSACWDRARAGVAAITSHPIETPGPRRGAPVGFCELRHGVRQRIRRTDQELDDMGRGGIPLPGDVLAVIAGVPRVVQVVLIEVGEQL